MPFIVKSRSSQMAQTLKSGIMGIMQGMQLKAQMERNKLLNRKTEKEIEWGEAREGRAVLQEGRQVATHEEALRTSRQLRRHRRKTERRAVTAEERAVSADTRTQEAHDVGAVRGPDGEIIKSGPQARYDEVIQQYNDRQDRLDDEYEQAQTRLELAEDAEARATAQMVLDGIDQQRRRNADDRAIAVHNLTMGSALASRAAFDAHKEDTVDITNRQLQGIGMSLSDDHKDALNAVGFSPTSERDLERVQAGIYAQIGIEKREEFVQQLDEMRNEVDADGTPLRASIIPAVESLANMSNLWDHPEDIALVYRELGSLDRWGQRHTASQTWVRDSATPPTEIKDANDRVVAYAGGGFQVRYSMAIEEFEKGTAALQAGGGYNPVVAQANNARINSFETKVQELLSAYGSAPRWNEKTQSFDVIDISQVEVQLRTLLETGVANHTMVSTTVPTLGPKGGTPAPLVMSPSQFSSMGPGSIKVWAEEQGQPHPSAAIVYLFSVGGAMQQSPGIGYKWEDPDDPTSLNVVLE